MPLPRVSSVHELSSTERVLKATLAGKAAIAALRLRNTPVRALRARRAERRDGFPASGGGPRRFTAVYVIPAGPRDWQPLQDTVESIVHYEGGQAKVVVADDNSVACRAAIVRERFPDVDVIRGRWPSGGPPRQAPFQARIFEAVRRRYDFDVLIKMDTDAIVTGPGLGARAAEEFARHSELGALGSLGVRGDGVLEDYSYDAWTLAHSRRWSRTVRRLLARARGNGYDGPRPHGGVYILSRAALDVASADGLLALDPPLWSLIPEDLWFSLVVAAAGFRLASFGAPGEPLVSASHYLPLPKEEVLSSGKLAVHSVRRGSAGESEEELRRFFRAARRAPQRDPAG